MARKRFFFHCTLNRSGEGEEEASKVEDVVKDLRRGDRDTAEAGEGVSRRG